MSGQTENPRAGRRDAVAVLEKIVHALEEKVQLLMNEQGELYETVSVLESSICRCGDCVMHRDKARHGGIKGKPDLPCGDSANLDNGLDKGAFVIQAPSEEAPAWQRAKVGDRVTVRIDRLPPDTGVVVEVGDEHKHRLRVNRGGGDAFWTRNERILSILPPEPAAPVQDTENEPAICVTCGGERKIPRAGPTLTSAWGPCPTCRPKTPVRDDHKTAGLSDICRTAAPVQDVRQLVAMRLLSNDLTGEDNFTIAKALFDDGFLSGAPQTVTRAKLLALLMDFDEAAEGSHLGELIDKHFPGLDVVEG